MTRVTYIEFSGKRHAVDVPDGYTLMEGAVNNQVPGIDGDCGGACACATCHVYVPPDWAAKIPEPGELETGMLAFAHDADATSRLACQIKVTPELDGIEIRMPARQY
jgi:2Fe-2S ferredoxin